MVECVGLGMERNQAMRTERNGQIDCKDPENPHCAILKKLYEWGTKQE